jgi:hypothetical protein
MVKMVVKLLATGMVIYLNKNWVLTRLFAFAARRGGRKSGKNYLEGAFAPVKDEIHATNCLVEGEIPKELLGGTYLRNGPNPMLEPFQDYHWCGWNQRCQLWP